MAGTQGVLPFQWTWAKRWRVWNLAHFVHGGMRKYAEQTRLLLSIHSAHWHTFIHQFTCTSSCMDALSCKYRACRHERQRETKNSSMHSSDKCIDEHRWSLIFIYCLTWLPVHSVQYANANNVIWLILMWGSPLGSGLWRGCCVCYLVLSMCLTRLPKHTDRHAQAESHNAAWTCQIRATWV